MKTSTFLNKILSKSIKFLVITSSFLTLFTFISCRNFMNSKDVRKEIEDAIAEANAPKIEVTITSNEGTGSTIPYGIYQAKMNYPFSVSFTENSKYCFNEWKAVYLEDGKPATDKVIFEDSNSLTTKVTVQTKSEIKIYPEVIERIAIQGEPSPRYEPNGVSRDRAILVRFTKPLDPACFIFTNEELELLPENAIPNKTLEGEKEVVYSYTIPEEDGITSTTYFKNISITNEYDYSLVDHFMPPIIEDTLLTIHVNKNNPIDFDINETKKTVKVTLNGAINGLNNSAPMVTEKSWTYIITEETDEKATVEFRCDNSYGTVSLNGARSYNIGTKIPVSFTEEANYQFIRWIYDASVLDVDKENSKDAIFLVKEKTTDIGITVTAECAIRPAVVYYNPKTSETNTEFPKNSQIEIEFNQPLPQDEEGLAQLNNIMITTGGISVKSCFAAPKIVGNTVIFSPDDTNMISVPSGNKNIEVHIPGDFYYLYKAENQTQAETPVTIGGNGFSFNYIINDKTRQQARITITTTNGSGTITPSGSNDYSLGDEIQINFTKNDDYKFLEWSITKDGSDVSNNDIQIKNSDKTSLTLIIHKALTGVIVEPKTQLIPKVTSITPEYSNEGVRCDHPITIQFNKPIFDYNNVFGYVITITEVYNKNIHYESYFENPVWENDKVTIKPKYNIRELLSSSSDQKNLLITLYCDRIFDTDSPVQNLTSNTSENTYTYSYRINYSTETYGPEIQSFSIYKPKLDENYHEIEDDEDTEEIENREEMTTALIEQWDFTKTEENEIGDASRNHIKDKVYFTYSADDKDSGFYKLTINETWITDSLNKWLYNTNLSPITYNETATWYKSKGNQIEYTLKSINDGLVQLDYIFSDNVDNKTIKTVYVIKDTKIDRKSFIPEEMKELKTEYLPTTFTTSNGNTVSLTGGEIKQFKTASLEQINKLMPPANTNTVEQTLTFKYENVKDKCFNDRLPQTKANLIFNIKYGESESTLSPVTGTKIKNDNNEEIGVKFTFNRDIKKNCYIQITATDIAGNERTETRIIPAQLSIMGDRISNSNNSKGNYDELNIGRFDEFKALAENMTDVSYCNYFFFPNGDNYKLIPMYSSINYRENYLPIFYTKCKDPLIDAAYFAPDGIYECYILPFYKYNDEFYYGTISKGYYYNKTEIPTISGDNILPVSNVQFQFYFSTIEQNLSFRPGYVYFVNGFSMNPEYEYGIAYKKKTGENSYETNFHFDGLNFNIPSGYTYRIYVYAKDKNGNRAISTDYREYNLTEDNIPPKFSAKLTQENQAYYSSYYHYPDINKFYIYGGLFPTDNIGLKTASNKPGYCEIEYCITPYYSNSTNDMPFLTNEDLESGNYQLKKAVFEQNAKGVILDFDGIHNRNPYTLTIRAKDNKNNYSIFNINVELYSTFMISPLKNVEFKKYEENNIKSIWFSYPGQTNSTLLYGLNDNEWKYIDSSPNIERDNENEDVYDNSVFMSLTVNTRSKCSIGSIIDYICYEYEWNKLHTKNYTNPCNEKCVIPAYGGGYRVYYDAPCFIHTMAYPTNDLDYLQEQISKYPSVIEHEYQVWETLGREYGLKLLNSQFLSESTSQAYYEPYDDIPSGYSYVTIVHFADGTAVMGEIRSKP